MGFSLEWEEIAKSKGLIEAPATARRVDGERRCFVLPCPPTSNNLFISRRRGKGRFSSKAYVKWQGEADAIIRRHRPWGGSFPVELVITVLNGRGWKSNYDTNNREKATTDALVRCGIIPDDSVKYLAKTVLQFDYDKEDRPCLVKVVLRPYTGLDNG